MTYYNIILIFYIIVICTAQNLKENTELAQESKRQVNLDNNLIWESYNPSDKHSNIKDVYRDFENDISFTCLKYMKDLNKIRAEESTKENEDELKDWLKVHKEIYMKFDHSLKKIVNEYKEIILKIGDNIENDDSFTDNSNEQDIEFNQATNEDIQIIDSWRNRKIITVNGKDVPFINNEIQNNGQVERLYNNKLLQDIHYNNETKIFSIDISLKSDIIIEQYLNNKKWSSDFLFIEKLKYNDIVDDLNILGITLDERNQEELKKEWMKIRQIYVNSDYRKSIDKYLKESEDFITIYDEHIQNEQTDNEYLYVDISLKYVDIIADYLVNDLIMNYDLLSKVDDYKYDEIIEELDLLGIPISEEKQKKLKLELFSFVNISTILNDVEYDKYLKEWLGNEYEWKLIYRASEHGYTAKSFHEYCDNVRPTLIIIKSHNGYIFGGYTTQSWSGKNEDKIDKDAFLFTLYNAYEVPPTRYNVLKDKGGISCNPSFGPVFCKRNSFGDIVINNWGKNCNVKNSCYIWTDGTHGYECDPKYKMSLFVNTAKPDTTNYFSVSDYEVFAIDFKDIDTVIKTTGYSLEIKGLEIIEKPLNNPSLFLPGTRIVDIEYDQYLRQWLGNEYNWKLIYRVSEHGYTGESFHEYCDDVGPTLIIIKSRNGYIFGGYTTKSWKVMNPDARGYNDAFLFTLYNPHGVPPTRYNALKDKGGISCHAGRGPSFTDNKNFMVIFLNYGGKNCNEQNSCFTNNDGTLGYEYDPQYKSSLFVNTDGPNSLNNFSISDYEVFAHQ